ncbi:TIGR04282 family arsenosugar biosynthesis glycosyltransferase [Desulfoluna butyratoxydans]|uniref:Nucleotide-diphospho-sugar transferases n=1 Tax=Desulfoluna butyratoxydans TaxID=231438 RepID=A0A4U8YQ28_9BACT|nr:TIGR04282 family arsenosugar biosynthesis glycosyltransferase [Desulfoluna butyratoxydans]VFQ45824.1 nucleotide-diphospho-sugar transferases [Desulfoluna butyratoxydans]
MPLIILFVKAPELGKVKTRLATRLGHATALALYRRFVETTLERLAPLGPIRIAYTPKSKKPLMEDWFPGHPDMRPQRGADLGERMKNALTEAFDDGHHRAVIIGGDIPDLPTNRIREAFHALEGHQMVLVPVSDGGYCLVGARKETLLAPVFDTMRWSCDTVTAETLKRAEAHGISLKRLDGWHDIDTADDFLAFVRRHEETDGVPALYRDAVRLL